MTKKHIKTKEEWKKELTPQEYMVTREKGTEQPFSGEYYSHKKEGIYCCTCCGVELFSSQHKYDSGSGWPSFDRPIDKGMVGIKLDESHAMIRQEIICNECEAHLGHVFDDGPPSTGERYCINSVSLKFKPKKP